MLHAPWEPLTRGDESAWRTFLDRYLPAVRASVARTLGEADSGSVEDVVQDVFLRLCRENYRLLRRFDPSRSPEGAWLVMVARGVAIEHRRRRRSVSLSPEAARGLPSSAPASREPIEIPPGLLSGRETLVLRLLFDEELDVPEVARVLGISPQTVRSTKHNAIKTLRKHLESSPGEKSPAVLDETRGQVRTPDEGSDL